MATKRQFDPAVGGGVDRAKLEARDHVFPDTRTFPIVTPDDVEDAVRSWGRYKGPETIETFKRKLIALAKRKGEAFVRALPEDWKREMNAESAPETPAPRAALFVESLDLSEATADVDERVIRNAVLIKAGMSSNRRYYSDTVLQNAVPVFEGAKAYADHPGKQDEKNLPERSVRDLTGWYSGAHYAEGALRADRHFTRNQAGQDLWAIAEDIIAGRAPATLAGLSIRASGTGVKRDFDDGEALEVESITAAISVDDVTTPAAGGMYLAASGGDELLAGLMAALSFEEWREARPDYVDQLKKEWQVVRQTEAVKAAQAEADQLREALASAEQARDEAQATLTATADRDASLLVEARRLAEEANADRDAARRDLKIEQLLRRANLPSDWETSLRKRLEEADITKWDGILEDEITKAKHIARPRPARVAGTEPQQMPAVNLPPIPAESADVRPRDDEDVAAWQKRIRS